MFDFIVTDDRARLTLDRPAVRNAIGLGGWDALTVKLGEVERSGARLLVVSGAGAAFCAGADLSDFEHLREDPRARAAFRVTMRRALDRLRALPIPTIAVVDGPCFGAGVALAMACDIRIAGTAALFAITPALMGISYPQEDVHRLVALVGPGQAARLLFGGGSIDAAEALRIGLVEMLGDAEPLVSAILANDPASLDTLKRAIALAATGVRSDAAQDRAFDALFGSEALAARLAARRKR